MLDMSAVGGTSPSTSEGFSEEGAPVTLAPGESSIEERQKALENKIKEKKKIQGEARAELVKGKGALLTYMNGQAPETFAGRLATRALNDSTGLSKGIITMVGGALWGMKGGIKGIVAGAFTGFFIIGLAWAASSGTLPFGAGMAGGVLSGAFVGACIFGRKEAVHGPKMLEQGLNNVLIRLAKACAGKDDAVFSKFEEDYVNLQRKERDITDGQRELEDLRNRNEQVSVHRESINRYKEKIEQVDKELHAREGFYQNNPLEKKILQDKKEHYEWKMGLSKKWLEDDLNLKGN